MILAMYLASFCMVMGYKTESAWFGFAGCVMFLIAEIRYYMLKDRIEQLEKKERNNDQT